MSKLSPITNGGRTIGISRIESNNRFNGKLYLVNTYAVGTAKIIDNTAVIQHVWKVSHIEERIDSSFNAVFISSKDVYRASAYNKARISRKYMTPRHHIKE